MRKFYQHHKKSILWQAIQSGSIISLFVYAVPRIMAYDFPMSWTQELMYFLKMYSCSLFVVATATGGPAWLYRSVLKMRLHKTN